MFTLLKRFNRLLRSSSNSHRGYTLIELVVVMSMSSILVLAAVRFVSDISTLSRTHRLEQESYRD